MGILTRSVNHFMKLRHDYLISESFHEAPVGMPESAFGSIMSTNVTIQAISRGAGMVPEVSGRSAEPVAKICARLDPKQDMLKGGDADAVAKCWTFTNSL